MIKKDVNQNNSVVSVSNAHTIVTIFKVFESPLNRFKC